MSTHQDCRDNQTVEITIFEIMSIPYIPLTVRQLLCDQSTGLSRPSKKPKTNRYWAMWVQSERREQQVVFGKKLETTDYKAATLTNNAMLL